MKSRITAAGFWFALVAAVAAQQPASVPAPSETPPAVYTRYFATIQTAKTVEELYEFWSEPVLESVKRMGIDLAGVRVMHPVHDVKVVRTVKTEKADVILFLVGIARLDGTRTSGSVVLTPAGGTWKMTGMETWTFPR